MKPFDEHGAFRPVKQGGELRRRARESLGLTRTQCGAVAFVQRFNSALGLNVHFHAAVLDGVYAANADGHPGFHDGSSPLHLKGND